MAGTILRSGVGPVFHDMLKPLAWLLGKWRSEEGKGKYPTIADFKYGEELEFTHVGQPNLQFTCYAWDLETKQPRHREMGFLRIKPGTNDVALVIAQNIGLAEVEEGVLTGESMKLTSHTMGRLSFGKAPKTEKIIREFKKVGGCLEQIMYMETENTPMTEHLRIKYTKVNE